jgi:hypothetical protein
MANDSVGSLYIDVAARTATLDTDVDKIKAKLNDVAKGAKVAGDQGKTSFDGLGNALAGTALKFIGVQAIIGSVAGELKHVYDNIQNIPGVPKATIDSVNNLKYAFFQMGVGTDQVFAKAIGLAGEYMDTVKWLALGMTQGFETAEDKITAANIKAAKYATMAYDTQMAQAKETLNAITMEGVGTDKLAAIHAHRITQMQQEAALLRTLAAGGSISPEDSKAHPMIAQLQSNFSVKGGMTPVDAQQANLQAVNLEIQAKLKLNEIDGQFQAAKNMEIVAYEKLKGLHATSEQRYRSEKASVDNLTDALNNIVPATNAEGKSLGLSADQKAKALDLTQKLILAEGRLREATLKLNEPVLDLAKTFGQSFSGMSDILADFITTGTAKFGDFFKMLIKQMISETIKLSVINPILNGLFSGIAGYQSAPAAFADGGAFSGGSPMLVGENGPELMIPGSSGTVIPAGKTASLMSGDSGGGDSFTFNYNVAAGVTKPELIQTLKGFQRMIETAITEKSKRGGSFKSSFA